MTWRELARCAGDPEAGPLLEVTTDRARRYCLGCPVLEPCLAAALVEELGNTGARRTGVRGGHSPAERDELARTLGRAGVLANLERTLALDAAGELAPAPWPPPPLEVRRARCAVCGRPMAQPRAGRPRLVCSKRCANRRWYLAHAEHERQRGRARWADLGDEGRDRARELMAARYRRTAGATVTG